MPVSIPDLIRCLLILTFSLLPPSQVWSFYCRPGCELQIVLRLAFRRHRFVMHCWDGSSCCHSRVQRHLQLLPVQPPQPANRCAWLCCPQPFMSTSTPSKIALHISSMPRSPHSCHHSNVKDSSSPICCWKRHRSQVGLILASLAERFLQVISSPATSSRPNE